MARANVVRVLTYNPHLPFEVLRVLTWDKTVWAGNYTTPPEVLEKLSRDEDSAVLYGVAKNPSTPPAALEKLSTDDRMQPAVGINPSTPTEILEKLGTNQNWLVRHGVAINPSTPVGVLESLSNDADRFVRQRAQARLRTIQHT